MFIFYFVDETEYKPQEDEEINSIMSDKESLEELQKQFDELELGSFDFNNMSDDELRQQLNFLLYSFHKLVECEKCNKQMRITYVDEGISTSTLDDKIEYVILDNPVKCKCGHEGRIICDRNDSQELHKRSKEIDSNIKWRDRQKRRFKWFTTTAAFLLMPISLLILLIINIIRLAFGIILYFICFFINFKFNVVAVCFNIHMDDIANYFISIHRE